LSIALPTRFFPSLGLPGFVYENVLESAETPWYVIRMYGGLREGRGHKEAKMKWLKKWFGNRTSKADCKKDMNLSNNTTRGCSESNGRIVENDEYERKCRCCGGTDGLYAGEDICSACDASYYS
jgi:hypothetical protein